MPMSGRLLPCFVHVSDSPRACADYWSEWKLCRSIRNLYHTYYTYGETPSCAQWKKDYKNCKEWERTKSATAKDLLCDSERARVAKKQKYAPVWKMRKILQLIGIHPLGKRTSNEEALQ